MGNIFSLEGVKLEEEELLSDLVFGIENTIQELTDIDERYNEIVLEEQVQKEAHVAAINHITGFAFIYLTTEFVKAIVSTVEYDHPLFIEHTQEALKQWEEMGGLIFVSSERPGNIFVDIKMHKMGTAEDWLRAAERAYPKERGIQDIGVRSHIWMEKIYKVDREGGTVKDHDDEDITEKYAGLWTKTIENRLNFISSTQVPWWEMINYGNRIFAGEGTPYPSFGPTYFVDLTTRAIEIAFYKYYNEVRAAFNFEESIELTKAAEKAIQEFDPNLIHRLKGKRERAQVYKILDQINADQKAWELYLTTGGKIGLRYSLSRNIRR